MTPPMDHWPDEPAHGRDSPVTVGFADERCADCGRTTNPIRHAVADWPDPTSDDPRDRWRCLDCWAELAARATPLSTDEARALGLTMAGYRAQQIARPLGHSVHGVRQLVKGARAHGEPAEGRETLARMLEFL